MIVDQGRFLLVQLEPGLHRSRQAGIFAHIKILAGVAAVTDLSVVSQSTLDAILLPPEAMIPAIKPKRPKARRSA